MKRRQFTQAFALLAGATALPASATASLAANRASNPRQPVLSRKFFEDRIGDFFLLESDQPRALRISGVETACSHHPDEQFHVVFDASPGDSLAAGIVQLDTGPAGRIDVFLDPGETRGGFQRLTATFNLQSMA